jgi:transposase
MAHDQSFKNLILDYPRHALAFFAEEEARSILADARVIPIRQEQLQERFGERFRELDDPLLVEWPDGRRAALLFVLEEETDPRRFSIHRLEAALSRHWPEVLGLLALDAAVLAALIAADGDPAWSLPMRAAPTRRELRTLEARLERRVGNTPLLQRMRTAVGRVSAAVLVAALGSPREYPDARSYTKAMGLNLKERSSGKHKGQLKLTKRGPPVARFYLYFAALRLIARDPAVKRWYECKTSRAGVVKSKAVIALMRQLAKALWHISRGAGFDAKKLFRLSAGASA